MNDETRKRYFHEYNIIPIGNNQVLEITACFINEEGDYEEEGKHKVGEVRR